MDGGRQEPGVFAEWRQYAIEERRGVMTKADLIDEVSRLAELTRKDSEVIVETIFDSVVRSLRAGDKIEIRGFGSFRTRQRKPRVGRNPKTGERVEVPAKKIPFFKPSKELKDLVNEGVARATRGASGYRGNANDSVNPGVARADRKEKLRTDAYHTHHPPSLAFFGAIREQQICPAIGAEG